MDTRFRQFLAFTSLVALFLAVCIGRTDSLKCVSCMPKKPGDCMGTVTNNLVECPPQMHCLKSVTTVEGIRTAFLQCGESKGCVNYGGRKYCNYLCDTDGCIPDIAEEAKGETTTITNSKQDTKELKCVQCQGISSGECIDTLPEPTQCPPDSNFCVTGTANVERNTTKIRFCSPSELSKCEDIGGNKVCFTSCNSNGCNTGNNDNSNKDQGYLFLMLISKGRKVMHVHFD